MDTISTAITKQLDPKWQKLDFYCVADRFFIYLMHGKKRVDTFALERKDMVDINGACDLYQAKLENGQVIEDDIPQYPFYGVRNGSNS